MAGFDEDFSEFDRVWEGTSAPKPVRRSRPRVSEEDREAIDRANEEAARLTSTIDKISKDAERMEEARRDPVRQAQALVKLHEEFQSKKADQLAALLKAQRDMRSSDFGARGGVPGSVAAGISNLVEGGAETVLGPELLSRVKESPLGSRALAAMGSWPSGDEQEQIKGARGEIEKRALEAARKAYQEALLAGE